MRLVLGLDIGITSCGYGIIDLDSNRIIDGGVRLFDEADKSNNEKRRSSRGSKRLKQRRKNRRKDLKKLLDKYELYVEYPTTINPYYARVKGVREPLTKEELNACLFQICKHRGSSLEYVDSDDDGVTKQVLSGNDALLVDKYVCDVQLERLQAEGKVRGSVNNFRSSDYEKELKQLLKIQSVDENIANEIIECILRKRKFSDGPGSFKSQTIYGKVYNPDGTVKMGMIEKMTGKCSVFPNELRAPKKAPSAELFNLLNDLNNLRINDEPVDLQLKQSLYDLAIEKGKLDTRDIVKTLEVDLSEISGFRIDKDDKPLITKLEGYRELRRILNENGTSSQANDLKLMDQIAVVLTKTKVREERVAELNHLVGNEHLSNLLSDCKKYSGYHSLSLKAIYIINDEMYQSTMNQIQVLSISGAFEKNQLHLDQKGKKKISTLPNAILSPVAMRSYKQAIKVVNAVRKKYGELDSIVVETTRDKNSAEQKKRIKETQKYYEDINKKVGVFLEAYPNIDANAKLKMKIRLYLEQDGKTAYSNMPIDPNLLVNDETAYEIDHIIPISVSLDDSINNKALVSRQENQDKGQTTPLCAFANGYLKNDVSIFKANVAHMRKMGRISQKKYLNYMYAKDITRYENMKDFIARNLVDTSYANRLVFNTLMDYFKDNGIDTKVYTTKGIATSAFRKYIKLEKNRDEDYSHHAIDAIIVASIRKMGLYSKLLEDFKMTNDGIVYSRETGEVMNIDDSLFNDENYIQFIKQIKDYKVTKFSYMIDTKPNRQIADQTIYSTRKYYENNIVSEYVVKKYQDIYAPKFLNLANDILNNHLQNSKKANDIEKYLMYRNDRATFDKIYQIVIDYYENYKLDDEMVKDNQFVVNPLSKYREETGGFITKYAKHNNGPAILSMKYVDGKLGNYVDLSQNYSLNDDKHNPIEKDKKVVLQQISPYRTDFYLDGTKYKFVTVRYSNIKLDVKTGEYVIDSSWYEKQKENKNISETAKFLFSLHRNEFVEITKDGVTELVRFTATNNDSSNVIEIKPISYKASKQVMLSVGSKIELMKKICCDPLGNLYEANYSCLKLRF